MIELDTGLPPAVRSEGVPAEARPDPKAWLREWEQARWNDQPRYERAVDRGEADAANAAPTSAAEALETRAQATEAAPVSVRSTIEASAGAAAQLAPVPAPLAAALGTASSPLTSALPPAARATALPVAKAAGSLALSRPERAAGGAAAEWATRSLHVQVDEGGTSVWIRDAKLSVQEALQLLEKLRPTLHRVGSDAAPVRLTLNGQAVAQDTAVPHPLSHPTPETPSWQSNPSD